MLDYLKPLLKLIYGVPGISEIEGGWYRTAGNFHKVDILCFSRFYPIHESSFAKLLISEHKRKISIRKLQN